MTPTPPKAPVAEPEGPDDVHIDPDSLKAMTLALVKRSWCSRWEDTVNAWRTWEKIKDDPLGEPAGCLLGYNLLVCMSAMAQQYNIPLEWDHVALPVLANKVHGVFVASEWTSEFEATLPNTGTPEGDLRFWTLFGLLMDAETFVDACLLMGQNALGASFQRKIQPCIDTLHASVKAIGKVQRIRTTLCPWAWSGNRHAQRLLAALGNPTAPTEAPPTGM